MSADSTSASGGQQRVSYCPWDGYHFVLDEARCGICGQERASIMNYLFFVYNGIQLTIQHCPTAPDEQTSEGALEKRELRKNGSSCNRGHKKFPPWRVGVTTAVLNLDILYWICFISVNMIEYDYWTVFQESSLVTQQLALVVIFVAALLLTLYNVVDVTTVLMANPAAIVFGWSLWIISTWKESRRQSLLKQLAIGAGRISAYTLALYVASPLLATLTHNVSDDTIGALSTILFLLHLFFQDYAYLSHSSSKFSAPVSLNAAIFASVMLASRLGSHLQVFSSLALAIQLFALFPRVVHHLRGYSPKASLILSWSLSALAVGLFLPLSRAVSGIFVAAWLFITFVCPFLLQFIMQFKDEIHGPWDEAVPIKRSDG